MLLLTLPEGISPIDDPLRCHTEVPHQMEIPVFPGWHGQGMLCQLRAAQGMGYVRRVPLGTQGPGPVPSLSCWFCRCTCEVDCRRPSMAARAWALGDHAELGNGQLVRRAVAAVQHLVGRPASGFGRGAGYTGARGGSLVHAHFRTRVKVYELMVIWIEWRFTFTCYRWTLIFIYRLFIPAVLEIL